MTVIQSLKPAENRARYFGVLRRSVKPNAAPPAMHADNPLMDDEIDDAPNQLHSRFQGFPLRILIPRFSEADDPGAVQGFLHLTLDGTPVGDREMYVTPVDPLITEFVLVLPEGLSAAPGTHELSYILSHGGNKPPVSKLIFNIDNRAPLPVGKAQVPPEVERDGITKKYLDDNDGKVLVTVPPHGEKKIGDVINCFFGKSLPLAVLVGSKTLTEADLLLPITFDLTSDKIGTEEGVQSLFYYLEDRKGNKSSPSAFTELNVTLTDPPEGLQVPYIPLFDDDTAPKLVDLADAQVPLGVGILDEYTNYLKGVDELEVTYDGIKLPALKINTFPFFINVPYSTVFNGDLGEKTVPVSYQIKRNGVGHPQVPLTKDVDVDLRRPGVGDGGENPNPTLALPVVKGAVTAGNNILREEDANANVSVSVAVFDGVKANDEVTLIWKGVELTDAQGGYKKLTGAETGNLPFTVIWDVVSVAGNAKALPVTYKITHSLNDNAEYSRPQDVDVFIRAAVVPELKILHLDPDFTDWFNCQSLVPDTLLVRCAEVSVGPGEIQLADQELEFTYQGYSDAAGTAVIPDTLETVKYTPTVQDATAGFIVKIPYQKIIATALPNLPAWGAVTYKAIIDGHPASADRHLVRVHVKTGDGNTCEI
ncbi:hypothetical protein ACIP1X_06885 [Pseudomonas sp. NPDC088885]|uniref:hypothetical protein n=1 Tax=Pseudomonas sp. NPDC088885 TaxID=3364457 RepID=UPI0037F91F27